MMRSKPRYIVHKQQQQLLMFSQSELPEVISEEEETDEVSFWKRAGRAWSGLNDKLKSFF